MKKMILLVAGILIFLGAESALANKAAVRLEAPATAAPGEKITIKLFVTHSANNFFHHTQRVYLTINGEEKASWDFGAFSPPEAAEFSRTFEYVMDGPITLESAAFCNVHGSAATATATIGLK